MIIFDAILLEKRVLFIDSGKKYSAKKLAQVVCAASMMVSPPMFGIIKRIFPCCSWADLDFLTVKGFIAGTKNSAFKMRNNWFDICCDLETESITGKVSEYNTQKYYSNDKDFIIQVSLIRLQILERLVNEAIDENGVRYAFSEYVRTIMDIAMNEMDYYSNTEMENQYINDQWVRIFAFKRSF